MFIAILDLSTSAANRSAALAQLVGEQAGVRAMSGCVNFRVFASLENDTDVSVVHEWIDEASFAAYPPSEEFRRSGVVLRPMLTAEPVSRRFHAELVETVN